MPAFLKSLLAAAACMATVGAQATGSIQLGSYVPAGDYAIPALGELGLEISAVTYARDRGTLFVVGDEGLGVIELSRTGGFIGSMSFDWTGTGSTHNDAEGLTYLGGSTLVVVDERPQMAYRFTYAAGGSVLLNSQPRVATTGSAVSVGNAGTEGISVDPRDGSFFTVKQDNPARLLGGMLSFAVGGGTSTMTALFEGATSLFGLASLSDVQTLGGVDALAGHAAADNLLILSLDSRRLIEIDRAGNILSSIDLSGLTTQALEGVTIDELGTIYLVAEDSGTPNSRLFVLTPVPEPGTYALLLSGLLALGWAARHRRD
jgi:uncharacterized protein YjiK